MRKLRKIPRFESEQQEREFWATRDSKAYLDWSKATVLNRGTRDEPKPAPGPLQSLRGRRDD